MSSRGRTPTSEDRCRSDRCASTKSASAGSTFLASQGAALGAPDGAALAALSSIVSSTALMRLVYDAAPSDFPSGYFLQPIFHLGSKIEVDDNMVAVVLG